MIQFLPKHYLTFLSRQFTEYLSENKRIIMFLFYFFAVVFAFKLSHGC